MLPLDIDAAHRGVILGKAQNYLGCEFLQSSDQIEERPPCGGIAVSMVSIASQKPWFLIYLASTAKVSNFDV